MKNLQTFEEAALFLGKDPKVLPIIEGIDECNAKAIIAAYKLFIISEAAWKTENKTIDWNNSSQYKYYPWFRISASEFSCDDCVYGRSVSAVGSRLVFPSYEVAEYIGNTHIDLYRDLMIL